MFDLNRSLDQWRRQLQRGGQCLDEDIAELEEHLREEAQALEKLGLSSEEAFFLAARRLGRVDMLQDEFGKVNAGYAWLTRFRWMAVGVVVYLLGTSLAEAVYRGIVAIAASSGLTGYWTGVFAIILTAAVISGGAYLFHLAMRGYNVGQRIDISIAKRRSRIGLVGGILACSIALSLCSIVLRMWIIYQVGPADFGRLTAVPSLLSLASSSLLPGILLFIILKTITPRQRVGQP